MIRAEETADSEASPRRKFRFGLRGLLILTTIVAVVIAKLRDYFPFEVRRDSVSLVVDDELFEQLLESVPVVDQEREYLQRREWREHTIFELRVAPPKLVDEMIRRGQPTVLILAEQPLDFGWPYGNCSVQYDMRNLPAPQQDEYVSFESFGDVLNAVKHIEDRRSYGGFVTGWLQARKSWGFVEIEAQLRADQAFGCNDESPLKGLNYVHAGALLYEGPVVEDDLIWASSPIGGKRHLFVIRAPRRDP